jgi:hypothetical protein
MTGQSQTVYTPSAQSTSNAAYLLRAHPDGTIFMVQQNPTLGSLGPPATVSQVVGINPSGGQKFSVFLWSGCIVPENQNFNVNNARQEAIIRWNWKTTLCSGIESRRSLLKPSNSPKVAWKWPFCHPSWLLPNRTASGYPSRRMFGRTKGRIGCPL